MADQEPQETSQGKGEPASNEAAGAGEAAQLPERIRVHALAKLLGTTSKRILAHLTELGAEARSAQSSLDRTVAESVRDTLAPEASEPSSAEPAETAAPADTAEPPAAEPEGTPAAASVGATETNGVAGAVASTDTASASSAAKSAEPATVSAAGSSGPVTPDRPVRQSLFTSPFHAPAPPAPEPVAFEPPAVVAAPLFLPPDATAAQEMRRKLRAERHTPPEEENKAAPIEEPAPAPPADEPPREPAAPRGEEPDADTDTDDTDNSWDEDQSHDDGEDGNRSRRRRRGRRGRGRGRGEQHGDQDSDDAEDTEQGAEAETDDEESAENGSDENDAVPEGSSRRRRRRRRRKSGEDAEAEPSEDDPPNTVVHEREPRNKRRGSGDEVQGISGSTRLEAKRQRRRDGREAGRRRPPILTESEFLARREAVDRVMVVREKTFAEHPAATVQVAVLEDNILVEHFVTSSGQASMVGNVYLGKVQNVLPSMEAAFVDIGRGRNGVLYAGEVNWEAAGLGGKERKIEQALKPGDTVLVQVSKDPVGHKGARLTTQISLAGRFLVYVPGGSSTGISRKLPDTERKRLKEILRDIVPQDAGVIIRTASEGVSETELARDVERLQATWKTIEDQSKNGSGAPKTLYEEPDLLVKVIRDLFNEDFSKLVIEGDRSWTTVENYIRTVAPDLLARVERHENTGVDVFGSFRIDEQLAKALDRKVWLPSGGTLVIDRTEAMTVIDVNTGKFTGAGGSNLEETVTRNNLEAAEEIVRQMRLRDIGGMIVVDFIDMVLESNRDLVLRRLTEALGRDRTRHQVSEVTSLGLVQMTRKKLGTGLVEAFSTTCEHCHGRGILVHNYPVETPPVEEGAGRREGRRRRKDKTPAPAPAPATNGTAPVEDHSEEDAAVKRAHPVALAMAAHQAEEAASVATAEAEVAVAAAEAVQQAAEADLADVSSAAAQQVTEPDTRSGSDRESEGTPGRTRRRARRGSRSSRAEALAESRNAEAAGTSEAADTSEAGADSRDAGTSESRSSAAAGTPEVAAEPRGAESSGAVTESRGAERSGAAAESGAEAGTSEAVAAAAPEVVSGGAAEALATGEAADSSVTSETEPEAASEAETGTAAAAASETAAETGAAPAGTAPAAQASPETGRRRRRVARTTAAPGTDSQGAVFVLSSAEQEAPAVDFTDIPAAPVEPRSRPRRRSAGRAAGAPEQPS
ncbi:translation initiation factor IF-2 N-terminal domain-containing protein [Nocardia blacklockiae]|uniref:translation initiation factor IF-2 N-terminal domain-containing protein n=1 Tax=Nocardia blacklockiae TaxID=480036 RepID=UPI002B4B237D|nr:translation initiation factor IF-2 N-terminal domain-containing protein [Nocardia blacklockiae]